jgi:hypothetical protein
MPIVKTCVAPAIDVSGAGDEAKSAHVGLSLGARAN